MHQRLGTALRAVCLAIVILAVFGASSASAALPVKYSFTLGVLEDLQHMAQSPAGSNVPCTPSAAHPRPVVLVHGTSANQGNGWGALAPLLKNHGYCVYSLNYGETPITFNQFYGLGNIADSAVELRDFVDGVLADTGADKVDIVGHSQGGMMPRYYLKYLGGRDKVGTLVGIAPDNNPIQLAGLEVILRMGFGLVAPIAAETCPACLQQAPGSDFITELNEGGATFPEVNYTTIATRYDELVQPPIAALPPGPNVTNIVVQNGCLIDFSDHLSINYSKRALEHTLRALGSSVRVTCNLVFPVL